MIDAIVAWDEDVLLYFQENIRTDWLSPIMKGISFLGHKGIFWIALCLVLLIFKKTRRLGIISSMSLALSFLVNNVMLKSIVGRVRPYEVVSGLQRVGNAETDTSFPSGHTACAFAVTVAFFFGCSILWPKIVLAVIAVLTPFSRIYLGVHYPTDVIVAMFTGTLCAVAMYFLFIFIEKKVRQRKQEKSDEKALTG